MFNLVCTDITSKLPDFVKDFRSSPETTIKCIGIAMHQVPVLPAILLIATLVLYVPICSRMTLVALAQFEFMGLVCNIDNKLRYM